MLGWLADGKHGAFRRQYALACEIRADVFADEIVELADAATPENANAVRLQVDAQKWIASRLLPKKYGDRLQGDFKHGASDELKAFFDSVSNAGCKEVSRHRSAEGCQILLFVLGSRPFGGAGVGN